MKTSSELIKKMTDFYCWLDEQLRRNSPDAPQCQACGRCCDFEKYDHKLFITTPEFIYLKQNLKPDTIKPMPKGRCPYNIDSKCSIYPFRFASCRIFCCKADSDFQSQLTERSLDKLKSLCIEFEIDYRYTDLANVLNNNVL